MPTITRITFSPVGSIQVHFVTTDKLVELPQDYIVHWGRVALFTWQAEYAERFYGWKNLGNAGRADWLAQGLVEVERSIVTYARICSEKSEEQKQFHVPNDDVQRA
jgi:hypothetical protein